MRQFQSVSFDRSKRIIRREKKWVRFVIYMARVLFLSSLEKCIDIYVNIFSFWINYAIYSAGPTDSQSNTECGHLDEEPESNETQNAHVPYCKWWWVHWKEIYTSKWQWKKLATGVRETLRRFINKVGVDYLNRFNGMGIYSISFMCFISLCSLTLSLSRCSERWLVQFFLREIIHCAAIPFL